MGAVETLKNAQKRVLPPQTTTFVWDRQTGPSGGRENALSI